MPTVYLLRHAKSSWDDASLADHDRPLAPRGRRAAPAMGERMRADGLLPDLVLCSTSARTRETWALVAPFLGADVPVRFERRLYGATARELLEVLRALGDDIARVLLIGHNPGMEVLAARLAGSGRDEALRRLRRKFPTAGLAVLTLAGGSSWSELAPGRCTLDRFLRPKDLPRAPEQGL